MDTLEGVDNKEFRKITPVLTNVTHACLMNLLSKNPRRLIISNEFSAFLASIGASWNQGMKQSITDLFDGETQSNMNMERTERIKNPNLSLLAASTEGWFYHQLSTNSEQLSGFMQRSLYYIISDVDVSKLNFDHVDTSEAWESLAMYDDVYQVFRSLPMSYRLKAEPEAMEYRNQCYKTILIQINKLNVDSIMSYCSRIYDGYLYKFATMITLFKHVGELAEAVANDEVSRFFQEVKVTMETIKEAIYMCDFYFQNTIPLLKLMSEQDKLAIETKLVNSLCRKHNGKASHSDLMRDVRIPKKVMKDAIETLIEMDIISVTTTHAKNGKTAKGYLLDPEIMASMLR
jgi:hypothetical protein